MERRLSAIMVADVVGFSRLMRSNEVGTLRELKAHLSELVEESIVSSSGRIVKNIGDGLIAEFSSVVSAASCAADIQQGMQQRNQNTPIDRRIEFRIGINVGDVIHDNDDVFGDGVNVAARIEPLAKPGGVAISGMAHEQIRGKTGLLFEDAGAHSLKNIDQPVQLFHLLLEGGPRTNMRTPVRELSVAVIPFVNISGDAEQEYFADGITEDLITDLSKVSELFVVGRNSVFAYKDKATNLIQIAHELGVRYLLEGSVRKAGQKVRITAQFIDGNTGGHIWAERYDRDLTDIFALQDEITKTIVEQLQLTLGANETREIEKTPTQDIDAYSFYLKGRQFFHMRTKRYLNMGREMFVKAVELDPTFARAYAGIADCDSFASSWFGANVSVDEILATSIKAIELEPDLAEAHAAKGLALLSADRRDEAEQSLKRALEIDPLCYEPHYYFARYCVVQQAYEDASTHYTRALEIRPDDYRSPLLLDSVLKTLGRDDERKNYVQLGLKRAENAVVLHPDNADPLELGASVLAAHGDFVRAREWLDRALIIDPEMEGSKYNIACTYSLLGEIDRAIDLLEDVVASAGPDSLKWINADPDMDPIRDHPRYQALMQTS